MGCHRNNRMEDRVEGTDIPANLTEYCVKGTDIPAELVIICGRYVRKLLAIRACGENCVLATQVGQ